LAKLGRHFGLDVWIGLPEISKNPELKQHRNVESLDIGIKHNVVKRLENVDIIWLKDKKIPMVLIEVENTTDPRDGLLRMSNIFIEIPHLDVKTITIIPDKKERVLKEIVDEPSIRRLIGEKTVYYLTYSSLARLFDEIEYEKISLSDMIKESKPLEAF
jgi:hypothetical protein